MTKNILFLLFQVSQRTHKCQAQPPGTVIRQTCDLVEKLKKKHENSDEALQCEKQPLENFNESKFSTNLLVGFPQISEANAEMARRGAKLSLEDMESENFTLLAEAFTENNNDLISSTSYSDPAIKESAKSKDVELFDASIGEFIDSIPVDDKNVPSPSEILKNLCLSKDEDYIGMIHGPESGNSYDVCKELNEFL